MREHVKQAFCWIMQELWKSHAGVPSIEELTHTLRELAAKIAPHGTFNFLLSNGSCLFAHCASRLAYIVRQAPFARAHLKDQDVSVDFSELTSPDDRVAVVATTPLTDDENWTVIEPGSLMMFVDGAPVAMGPAATCAFIREDAAARCGDALLASGG